MSGRVLFKNVLFLVCIKTLPRRGNCNRQVEDGKRKRSRNNRYSGVNYTQTNIEGVDDDSDLDLDVLKDSDSDDGMTAAPAAERRKYQRRPKDDDDDGRRKYKPRGQPAYGVAPSYGGYAQTNVVR